MNTLVLLCLLGAATEEKAPESIVIVEEYDVVAVIHIMRGETHERSRVYFMRDKEFIATRTMYSSGFNGDPYFMSFVNGKFLLQFRDYGWPSAIERHIHFKKLVEATVDEDTGDGWTPGAEWWMGVNNLRDLRQP